MGLYTGADLKKLTELELTKHFGKAGKFYFKIVRGIDDREVQPNRETKSVGAEDTFPYDLTEIEEMQDALDRIARIVYDRLERHELSGRTITLKIKYHNFKIVTRSQSFTTSMSDFNSIIAAAKKLLEATDLEDKRVRLLGISLSNFKDISARELPDQLRLEL
jgi:DNA polymerase-4